MVSGVGPLSSERRELVNQETGACEHVQATRAAAPTNRYRSLDIWRGTACLSVLVYHAAAYAEFRPGGDHWSFRVSSTLHHGVTIFFVLSGYCITASAVGLQRRGGGWTQYAIRRIRRIYPPFWMALAITVALVTGATALGIGELLTAEIPNTNAAISAIPYPTDLNIWQWIGNLSLTEGWRSLFVWRGGTRFELGTAWTLCYEEQFYALMGLLLVVSRGVAHRIITGGWIITTVTVITMQSAGPNIQGTFLDGRWLLFACGMVVYDAIHRITSLGRALGYVALCSAAAWGLYAQSEELAIAAAFGTLLVFVHRWDDWLIGRGSLKPLYRCGIICYSIYLIHYPVTKGIAAAADAVGLTGPMPIFFVVLPICAAASLSAASLFFRVVERRFLPSSGPSA